MVWDISELSYRYVYLCDAYRAFISPDCGFGSINYLAVAKPRNRFGFTVGFNGGVIHFELLGADI